MAWGVGGEGARARVLQARALVSGKIQRADRRVMAPWGATPAPPALEYLSLIGLTNVYLEFYRATARALRLLRPLAVEILFFSRGRAHSRSQKSAVWLVF